MKLSNLISAQDAHMTAEEKKIIEVAVRRKTRQMDEMLGVELKKALDAVKKMSKGEIEIMAGEWRSKKSIKELVGVIGTTKIQRRF